MNGFIDESRNMLYFVHSGGIMSSTIHRKNLETGEVTKPVNWSVKYSETAFKWLKEQAAKHGWKEVNLVWARGKIINY